MNYRHELTERWGFGYAGEPPDGVTVLTDTDDEFVFETPSGVVVGWVRNVETFWRNMPNPEYRHEWDPLSSRCVRCGETKIALAMTGRPDICIRKVEPPKPTPKEDNGPSAS